MKKIFKLITHVFYAIGRARAAGVFMRMGNTDMAKKILAND